MKKLFCFAAIAALVFASCAKVEEGKFNTKVPEGRKISLLIKDNAAVRSTFSEDVLSLSGDEPFRVCYVSDGTVVGSVKATGTNGNYEFVIPDGVEPTDYTWYAVGPWKSRTYNSVTEAVLQKASGTMSLPVPAIQTPGNNTPDPAADILISDAFEVTGEGEAEINLFKRLAAPLQLRITGLDEGDKIYAAALSVNSSNGLSSKSNTVVLSSNYASAGITAYSNKAHSVAALYQEGQPAVGGYWPVWLFVNPTVITAGADLTVTVTTATKTYSRTVPALQSELVTDKINYIQFNVKGSGYTEKTTIAQGFMDSEIDAGLYNSGSHKIVSTDGRVNWQTWRTGNSTNSTGYIFDGLPMYSLMCSDHGGTFKGVYVPTIPGATVRGITAYLHPALALNSTTQKIQIWPADAVAKESTDVVTYEAVTFPFGTIRGDDYDLSGLKFASSGTFNIAMLVLEVEDSYDPNDYKALYDRGKDIQVGNTTVNNVAFPNSAVVNVEDVATKSFNVSDKVFFIDNSEQESVTLEGVHLYLRANTVVIGRYKTSQPEIVMQTSTSAYIRPVGPAYFKNVRIVNTGSGVFTPADGASSVCSFTCDDCTFVSNGSIIREAAEGKKYGDLVFNNCVIQVGSTLANYASAGIATSGTEDSFTFTNCVIMPLPSGSPATVTEIANQLFPFGASGTGVGLPQFIMKNNTVYGFKGPSGGAALINTKTIGGFDIENNIFVGSWPAEKYNRIVKTAEKQATQPYPRIVSNNFCSYDGTTAMAVTNTDSQYFWNNDTKDDKAVGPLDFTAVGNLFTTTSTLTSPFLSVDLEHGYFPVNTAVVTNGAGADYSTKLWRTWTE